MNRAAWFLPLLLVGCQSPRPAPPTVPLESPVSAKEIERKLAVVRDPAAERYLEALASRLRDPNPVALRARLARAGDLGAGQGRAILMANVLYFPVHALEACRFENEAAALAALALSAGPAHEQAVDRLYRAGFDPRGVAKLLERQGADAKDAAQKIGETRARIALYPPLRNPVVSTEAFAAMKRRLAQLPR